MNLRGIGNIFGLFVGLAIVAVIAAKPDFIATTFTGTANVINAATRPVRG